MPTIVTHALLGAAVYHRAAGPRARGLAAGMTAAAVLSMLPDADVLGWGHIPYHAAWGHRGMTHGLLAAVAVGGAVALALRRRAAFPAGGVGLWALLAAVTASHGALDMLTDGGLGIALLAPFDDTRYFWPVRPIAVSPINPALTSPRLWGVLGVEVLLFWPLAWWTARRGLAGRRERLALAGALTVCLLTWVVRCLPAV